MTIQTITLVDNDEPSAPAERILEVDVIGDEVILSFGRYDGPSEDAHIYGDRYSRDSIALKLEDLRSTLNLLEAGYNGQKRATRP